MLNALCKKFWYSCSDFQSKLMESINPFDLLFKAKDLSTYEILACVWKHEWTGLLPYT